MEGSRFDTLAKSLATSGTRRRLIGGLIASSLGLVQLNRAEARTCTAVGTICREHANCCTGLCNHKDRTNRRYCGCNSPADCPAPGSTCQTNECIPPTSPPAPCVVDAQCDDNNGGTLDRCINGYCVSTLIPC